MTSTEQTRAHLLSDVEDRSLLALDFESLALWISRLNVKWRVLAAILPAEISLACQAAVYLALLDAKRISPRGSRKAVGHFRVLENYACCVPMAGTKPRLNHQHGHTSSAAHVCHEFGAPSCVKGVSELHRLVNVSMLLAPWSAIGYRDEDVMASLASLVEESWLRLMDARRRGSLWTFSTEHSVVVAVIREEKMIDLINRVELDAGALLLAPPRRSRIV